MNELLVPLKTTTANPSPSPNDDPVLESKLDVSTPIHGEIRSPEHALKTLKAHPQYQDLRAVLKWLHRSNISNNDFNIHGQTLQASQIIHTLVNDVLPDHWGSFSSEQTGQGRRTSDSIVSVLTNVTGISILTSRLKVLINWKKTSEVSRPVQEVGQTEALDKTMSILESVLKHDHVMQVVWSRLGSSSEFSRRWLFWKELVNLLGNGRVLSTASEADAILERSRDNIRKRSWLSDGSKYCSWIGRNLNSMLSDSEEDDNDARKAWVQMLERALTLGHIGESQLLYPTHMLLISRRSYDRSDL